MTDSPKGLYYMETFGIRMSVRDVQTCIRWALTGRTDDAGLPAAGGEKGE